MQTICLSDATVKWCPKCESSKPRSEFYTHPKTADGLLGKCKGCAKLAATANRWRRVEYYRGYDVARFRDQPERRAATYARAKIRIADSPNAVRARAAVNNALRDGKLVRLPCEVCGHSRRVHGHHDDYDQPLSVRWLCVPHHALWHQENGEGKNR